MARSPRSAAQWTLAGAIAALALGAAVYRLLHRGHLDQTAALFVGLPAILAIAVALSSPAKSATGLIMKVMTIGLLLSGIVLGEGLICIIMASPLFYLVGWIAGAVVDAMRESRRRRGGADDRPGNVTTYGAVFLPFLLLSLEGTNTTLSFPRQETVAAVHVVAAAPAEVEAALAQAPSFSAPLPLYLRLGFPRPVSADGSGLLPGDRRTVQFLAKRRSALALEVAERAPGFVRFRVVSDGTPVARWLRWEGAEVRWQAVDGSHTRVEWTLRYERRLDPAWYFAPWERYATRLAAGYLIEAAATPLAPGAAAGR